MIICRVGAASEFSVQSSAPGINWELRTLIGLRSKKNYVLLKYRSPIKMSLITGSTFEGAKKFCFSRSYHLGHSIRQTKIQALLEVIANWEMFGVLSINIPFFSPVVLQCLGLGFQSIVPFPVTDMLQQMFARKCRLMRAPYNGFLFTTATLSFLIGAVLVFKSGD